MNLKSELENPWLIKRAAISATYFFSISDRQRAWMRNQLRGYEVNNFEDLRKLWGILPEAWNCFMKKFAETGGVVRQYNGNGHIGQVRDSCYLPTYFSQFVVPQGAQANGGTTTVVVEGIQDETGGNSKEVNELREALSNEKTKSAEMTDMVARLGKELAEVEVNKVVSLELTNHLGTTVTIDRVHKCLPKILRKLNRHLNVYMVGPAGSGKTTAAEQAAECLGLEFGFMSVGPQTTKSDIFGYMSAVGDYVHTEFRRRFEHGGVFLFDEIDAAHPGVLTQINAALAGSSCAFPDGMVKKHAEFRCVAAGNTFGTGADRKYVGRNKLDAASLDRFAFVEWPYDEGLELDIAKSLVDDESLATEWAGYVRRVRKSVENLGFEHVVSPRATFGGVQLLEDGDDREDVESSILWKHLKPTEIDRIKANMKEATSILD